MKKKMIFNSLYGTQAETQILKKKNSELDFELTISIIVGIVAISILVFACCYASTRIIKLEERIHELESNIERVEEQRWFANT